MKPDQDLPGKGARGSEVRGHGYRCNLAELQNRNPDIQRRPLYIEEENYRSRFIRGLRPKESRASKKFGPLIGVFRIQKRQQYSP